MKKILITGFYLFFVNTIFSQEGNTPVSAKIPVNTSIRKVNTWDGKVQGRLTPNITATCKKCGKQVELADLKTHPSVCTGKPSKIVGNEKLRSISASEWVCHCCYKDEESKGHKIPCPACKDQLGLIDKLDKTITSGFKDWSCLVCKKSFSTLFEIEKHIDEELNKPVWSYQGVGKNITLAGYQCDCCQGVYTAEQLIAHAKTCCKVSPSGTVTGKIKSNCPPPCDWDSLVPEVVFAKGASFPYTCNCCRKTLEFSSGSGASVHSKECCPPPPATPTGTVNKMIGGGSGSYVCAFCNEPISGGSPGLAKHESEVHNSFAIRDGLFNGKKKFLNNDELKTVIQPLLPKDVEYKNAYIQKSKVTGEFSLVCYMCIRADGKLVYCDNYFTLPLLVENGYLRTTFRPLVANTTNQQLGHQRKSDYVGHVTLLR